MDGVVVRSGEATRSGPDDVKVTLLVSIFIRFVWPLTAVRRKRYIMGQKKFSGGAIAARVPSLGPSRQGGSIVLLAGRIGRWVDVLERSSVALASTVV